MRILHTADWHLGQNLMNRDRAREHQLALDWLIQQIHEQGADGLILAGDVFDIPSPPNYARRLYYQFLTRLLDSPCRHILIVGGNHDSPSMLEAPAELLEALQIRVLGAAPAEPERALVEWRNDAGELEAVLAAVPFLRDRDLKSAIAGETGADRIRRIREGILNHYRFLAERAGPYRQHDIPLIATGHLYAKGARSAARQDNIYVGDLENIDADTFPEIFDYVALGHLHRQQRVGGREHLRYSGSLIPLSFSETADDKGVLRLDFAGQTLDRVEFLEAPTFRRLKTIRGEPEGIREKLRSFAERDRPGLTPWVEVLLPGHAAPPGFVNELRDFIEGEKLPLDLLKVTFERSGQREEAWEEASVDLEELSDLDVFGQRCTEAGVEAAEREELMDTFRELLAWMQEEEAP